MGGHVADVVARSERLRLAVGREVAVLRIREDDDSVELLALELLPAPVEHLTCEDAAVAYPFTRTAYLVAEVKSLRGILDELVGALAAVVVACGADDAATLALVDGQHRHGRGCILS